MIDFSGINLPVLGIAERVNDALKAGQSIVVTAPPGAGKSTILPLTILEGLACKGKILMLEPRRLAARGVAERMAFLLGETVGNTVGYRMRFETRVSSRTRIEVLTEGILTRMLVEDPTLEGVSVVIFDEFHERSLTSDLALALTRESAGLLRPDLRIVIMSATIDATAICRALGDAPAIESEGRMYPVTMVNTLTDPDPEKLPEAVAGTVRQAFKDHGGDILAFLPGEAEIRRCAELLENGLGETKVYPLYGMLSSDEQKAAISPSRPGERKIVLATPIAETSITIEGVRVVVDSGYCRRLIFDPQTSLSHLETVRISRDMAGQRAGRAGRTGEGTCYRLWSLATENRMEECRRPEIMDADLSGMVLDIAAWGESDPSRLPWLTPPPPAHLSQAKELLRLLGAIDENGKITAHGKALSALPCHPRIAQMLTKAKDMSAKALATDIAAILEEKDPLSRTEKSSDISLRISALRRARKNGASGAWKRISIIAQQYRKMVNVEEDNADPDPYAAGILLAEAYPERIGHEMKDGFGKYQLSCGDMVFADKEDDITAREWIAVASMNAGSRIFLSAPVAPEDLLPITKAYDNVSWDSKKGTVVAQREQRAGRLVIASRPISEGIQDKVLAILCEAARKDGLGMFDFSDSVGNLQRRIAVVSDWHHELEIPDLSTETVLERASEWLPLYAGKARTKEELRKIDMTQVLWGLLSYDQQTAIDEIAPTHIKVASGNRIRLEYRQGAVAPVLRVRLQECFGMMDTPTVDRGRRKVLMELLSPGFKPVQLTQDLRSFWQTTYFEVRSELRRRYPKHAWPEDPTVRTDGANR